MYRNPITCHGNASFPATPDHHDAGAGLLVYSNVSLEFPRQRSRPTGPSRESPHLLPRRSALLWRPRHPRDSGGDSVSRKPRHRVLYRWCFGPDVLRRWPRARCTPSLSLPTLHETEAEADQTGRAMSSLVHGTMVEGQFPVSNSEADEFVR